MSNNQLLIIGSCRPRKFVDINTYAENLLFHFLPNLPFNEKTPIVDLAEFEFVNKFDYFDIGHIIPIVNALKETLRLGVLSLGHAYTDT